MGRKKFGLEGCVVIPTDMEFYVPLWHENYVKVKVSQGSGRAKIGMSVSSEEDSDVVMSDHFSAKRNNKRKSKEEDKDKVHKKVIVSEHN